MEAIIAGTPDRIGAFLVVYSIHVHDELYIFSSAVMAAPILKQIPQNFQNPL
jgi:hypothetical protein